MEVQETEEGIQIFYRSKIRAMSYACLEIISLQKVLSELGFPQNTPTPLHADNTSAMRITVNLSFMREPKRFKVDCRSIQEAYDDHTITLPCV